MKLLFCLLSGFLCSGIYAQSLPGNIQLNPAAPVAGSAVSINYQTKGNALEGEPELTLKAIRFLKNGEADTEYFTLNKSGNTYKGTVHLPDSTDLLAFIITSGDKKDDNGEKGYLVPVKLNSGSSVPNAYLSKASYYNLYINYGFELPVQPEKSLEMAKKAYEENPANSQAIAAYVNSFNRVKGKNGEEELKALMDKIVAEGNMDENNYSLFMSVYSRMKETDKANELKEIRNSKFPEGSWLVNEKMQQVYNIQDDAEKEKEILALLNNEKFSNYKNRLNSMLLDLYHENGDKEKMEKLVSTASVSDMNSAYNNIAWAMAEEGSELETAKKLSEAATNWAKKNISNPEGKKPPYYSTKDWENSRKMVYSMYADTYAFILYKLGDYKNGFNYAKDAAEIREFKSADYNDRYALLLEKNAQPKEVKQELEKLVEKGAAGSETQEVLKRAYLANNNSEAEYEKYIAGLKLKAKEYLKKELMKKLINEPAEGFTLVNLEGKKVDLKDYKGKTVVLDFWATWCGPCIASFPGMQKAVNKYEKNDKVAFLFIDTWEDETNREQKVKDFIAKNNYSFHVLYDTPKQENPDEYDVVSRYKVDGIPTKFVIDKSGNIRFKSVGFAGSTDGLVDELEAMIELVQ